ncbi:glutaredoxin [Aquimarina sp. 2201CG5-10]|uniref:glutaredoxin family protein n=1 Tax=Aquimarina callyspongiae TaxID=3098150 RepID=UPI002AB32F8D|nr:glutaredoxin [Aquimarina sp. 2201CG5-10]MDY8134081.1 glutaredoxin [Aquimarina sp. 2201CG5-10]
MKNVFHLHIFILLFSFTVVAQENPVRLIEEVQKKRTILYVQNDTDTDKSVFLKVNPIGYRRSAQRPVIKNIPAKSKTQILILIPLTDVDSHYTYDLIVNEQLKNIDVDRSKNTRKEAPVSSILRSEIIIFTKKGCKKCELLISKLKEKHIKYREVNIDTKSRYREYLWELLNRDGYDKNTIGVPLGIIKGKLQYPIDDLDTFILSVSIN